MKPVTVDAELQELDDVAINRQYAGLVYWITRRYALDADEADDIAQEIWVQVGRLLPRKDPRSPVQSWLRIVATNVAMKSRDRRGRWERLKARVSNFLTIADGQTTHVDPLDDRVSREVWQAVMSLPALQREVVVLRVFENCSIQEAAERLGVRPGTVQSSLNRANKKLGKQLEPLRKLWEDGNI